MDRLSRLLLGAADLREDDVTPALLDRYYDAGGRNLDLANVYGADNGDSSTAVGRWLARSGRRGELTLFVKGCHPPYCAPALVEGEIDRARTLLGVERLDSFTLHRDDPDVPVEAFAEALVAQVERGAIAGFGVSNWTYPRFAELHAALGADAPKLVLFSNHFSLADMITPTWPGCLAMSEHDIEALRKAGVIALAWAALAGGFFAGRDLESWQNADNVGRRARAAELAATRGVTTPAIALAYVLHQPENVYAAIGTRSLEHLDQLLVAPSLELSRDELIWLEGG
jgi:aryl-alcohol dehydrogenase-like predicted oxidoreductase